MPLTHLAAHVLTVLLLPPLLLGIIVKVKAAFAGRVGAPLLQPLYDLIKLLRKGTVLSRTTTWMFLAGPVVALATALLASLLVPLGHTRAPIAFAGDMLLFAYLFALGRFFTVAAALDTGSAFEGMGGAREVTFACLAEPALFLALLALAKESGSLSLSGMLVGPWGGGSAPLMLVVVSLFIVMLAETSRIPFDDPNTHLELTMIHEVMVLDHGGPLFGLVLQGAAVKLFVLAAVVVRVVLPVGPGGWQGWAMVCGAMIACAVAIGIVESVMARLQMRRVPSLLVAACLLSGFGMVLLSR